VLALAPGAHVASRAVAKADERDVGFSASALEAVIAALSTDRSVARALAH
jgi:hypothetical protein